MELGDIQSFATAPACTCRSRGNVLPATRGLSISPVGIRSHIHTYMCTYMRACIHYSYIHACTRIPIHIYREIHTYIYIYTLTCVYIYIYMNMCNPCITVYRVLSPYASIYIYTDMRITCVYYDDEYWFSYYDYCYQYYDC